MNDIVKVGNHELSEVEWKGERVITTAQLAEVYETSPDNVKVNFNRNAIRFQRGKHFYLLEGEELKLFKNQVTDSYLVDKHTSQLYLWTRRGASRHCKILDTEKAWEQFDYLEEAYFNPQPTAKKLSATEMIKLHYQAILEVDGKVDAVNADLQEFKRNLPLLPADADEVKAEVNKVAVRCLGGKESNAYKDKTLCHKVYWDIYNELKRQFEVSQYKYIRQSQKTTAVNVIRGYQLPIALKEQIEDCNAQMNISSS